MNKSLKQLADELEQALTSYKRAEENFWNGFFETASKHDTLTTCPRCDKPHYADMTSCPHCDHMLADHMDEIRYGVTKEEHGY